MVVSSSSKRITVVQPLHLIRELSHQSMSNASCRGLAALPQFAHDVSQSTDNIHVSAGWWLVL